MQASRRRLEGSRVLLVDDTAPLRRSLARFLGRVGVTVIEAEDAASALAKATTNEVDVILIDNSLPDSDGVDLCRLLRLHPSTRRVPIGIITGQDDVAIHAAALEAGADDFVSKPFHPRILVARVANLVGRYRAERENERLVHELERYMSRATVAQAIQPRAVEKLRATILFSDMRGFTASAMEMDLAQMFRAMNMVLARQTEIVQHWGGYVDKFSGDGMLAVFCDQRSAYEACRAAVEIVQWASSSTGFSLWEPLPIGIGVHHGEVMRGDLGSETRREFTVMGHTVNVAARLCGVARALEVVVSDSVAEDVRDTFNLSAPNEVMLKGLPEATRIHRVRGLKR